MVDQAGETTKSGDQAGAGDQGGAQGGGNTIATRSAEEGSAGDQVGDGEKGDEAEGEDKGDKGDGSDESAKAPEKYADFKLPENFKLEGEDLERAAGIFKKLDLSQDMAQELIDWEVARQTRLAEEAEARRVEQTQEWAKEVESDEVLGGKNLKRTEAACARALMAFDLEGELADILESTGLGNRRGVVRFLAALGSQIREDSGGQGDGSSGQGNGLEKLYPTMFAD